MVSNKDVCIVGAGLSGLVCGYRLSKAGFNVHIIEELTYPGGLLASTRIGSEYLEILPHHIRKTDRYLLSLIRELNLTDDIDWFDSYWHGRASRRKLGYFKSGFAELINCLTQEIIDRHGIISYSTTVAEIVKNESLGKYCTSYILTNSEKIDILSDYVIFTGSCRTFANVSHGLPITINTRDQIMNVTYKAELCVMMILKKQLSEMYFQNITEGPFKRIVFHSNCFGERKYGGHAIYLVGECSISEPLWIETDSKIFEAYFAKFRKLFPNVTKSDIKSWRLSKIRYATAEKYPASNLSSPSEGLFLCTSGLVSNDVYKTPENRMDGVIGLANSITDKIINDENSVNFAALPDS